MALPRKGLRGVEKTADTTVWTKSMAESARSKVKDHWGYDMHAVLDSTQHLPSYNELLNIPV